MSRAFLICASCCAFLLVVSVGGAKTQAGQSCVEGSKATPERMIEDCDALLMDKATTETKLPGIFLARAEAFVRQGRTRLAIDDLGNVVTRRPDNAQAFFRRAELHKTLDDTDAAIRDFSAGIRLEPKNATALFARAELYRARTDRRRALADYAAVMRLNPSNEAASANHKALAQEIERQGAMMPVQR